MQNQASDKTGCRLDPVLVMGAFFAASAQHLRDVLRVGYLAQRPDAHLGQRIEARAMLFHGSKAKADLSSGNPIASGAVPVLSFDVEDYRAFLPCQQRRNHEADTFARPRWCEGQNVLWSSVFQVFEALRFFVLPRPDVDAVLLIGQAGLSYLCRVRPSGASMNIFGVLSELPVLVYVEQCNNEECCCKPCRRNQGRGQERLSDRGIQIGRASCRERV